MIRLLPYHSKQHSFIHSVIIITVQQWLGEGPSKLFQDLPVLRHPLPDGALSHSLIRT